MKPSVDRVWEALKTKRWWHGPKHKHLARQLRTDLSTLPIFYLSGKESYTKPVDEITRGSFAADPTAPTGWVMALPYSRFVTAGTDSGPIGCIRVIERAPQGVRVSMLECGESAVKVVPITAELRLFRRKNGELDIHADLLGHIHHRTTSSEDTRAIQDGYINAVLRELWEINTASARRAEIAFVERRTPRQAAAASTAARKRGAPTWEYKLVEIKLAEPPTEPQGGTHASPRQHERRGHWRHYKSGKRVWIAAQIVGDPSRGVIKHSYVVSSAV